MVALRPGVLKPLTNLASPRSSKLLRRNPIEEPHRSDLAEKLRRQSMNRSCTRFVIASVLSLAVLLGLAWAANVEEELKKLETDRADGGC